MDRGYVRCSGNEGLAYPSIPYPSRRTSVFVARTWYLVGPSKLVIPPANEDESMSDVSDWQREGEAAAGVCSLLPRKGSIAHYCGMLDG